VPSLRCMASDSAHEFGKILTVQHEIDVRVVKGNDLVQSREVVEPILKIVPGLLSAKARREFSQTQLHLLDALESDPNDGDVVRVSGQRLQVMGIAGEHGSPRFCERHD